MAVILGLVLFRWREGHILSLPGSCGPSWPLFEGLFPVYPTIVAAFFRLNAIALKRNSLFTFFNSRYRIIQFILKKLLTLFDTSLNYFTFISLKS